MNFKESKCLNFKETLIYIGEILAKNVFSEVKRTVGFKESNLN